MISTESTGNKWFLPKVEQFQISALAIPVVIFLGSFALYWSTAARYPGWVDATLILGSVDNLTLGVWANTHNLFNVLGYAWLRMLPRVDPHFALTILCAVLGSLTAVFMYSAALELTRNRTASALASLALIMSLSLWWHSTTIEVYTLNTMLIALFLFFVFRSYRTGNKWVLYTAFFFAGLGISNHVLMGLYIFAFFIILLPIAIRRFRFNGRQAAGLVACFLAGTALFATLFIMQWLKIFNTMSAGSTASSVVILAKSLGRSLQYATGGSFQKYMFTRGLPFRERVFWHSNYVFLILLNYPSAAILFITTGFPRLWKLTGYRSAIVFYLLGLVAQIVWSANYFIWDMYAFALPVYVMLAIPLAAGIDGFLRNNRFRKTRWLIFATFIIPLLLYPSFSQWPNREKTVDRYIALYPEAERTGGIWDPAQYIFNPIKRNYRDVEVFVDGILKVLPHGANYWDDESKAAYPLEHYYQNILGRRRDVNVNTVFGLVMEEADTKRYARRMLNQIKKGEPVFISALVEPEREILNQMVHMATPGIPIEDIRSKNTDQFRRSITAFEVVDVPIVADSSLCIYELRTRPPSAPVARER